MSNEDTQEMQGEGEEQVPSHLTPEQAELVRERQKRNDRAASLLVTCLVYAGIILGLALIAIPALEQDAPQIRARLMAPTDPSIQQQQVTQTSRARPSAPSSSAALITSQSPTSMVFVPMVPTETQTLDIGASVSLGMGMGVTGTGDGQGGLGLGGSFRGRCTPEERMKRLREGGGNEQVAAAVIKGLDYFKSIQAGDGSWGGGTNQAAMTGLVLLCYLAHCETPQSREYGDTVSRAITYLIQVALNNDGYISTGYAARSTKYPYEHAIGLYALSEALTFANELKLTIPNLKEVCEKGFDIVLSGQNPSGAWNYNYDLTRSHEGGDTSILVWHMQAIKAAEHAGLTDDRVKSVIDKAFGFLDRAHNEHGTFSYHEGYRNVNPTWRLAGAGAFTYQLFDRPGHANARSALKYIRESVPKMDYNDQHNMPIVWYYNVNAAFQAGGSDWQKLNSEWRDTLLSGQVADGSWKEEGGYGPAQGFMTSRGAGSRNETVYRTALSVLQLCVYFRFLPGTG